MLLLQLSFIEMFKIQFQIMIFLRSLIGWEYKIASFSGALKIGICRVDEGTTQSGYNVS